MRVLRLIDFHHDGELARWSRILLIRLIALNALFLCTTHGQSPQPSGATPPVLRTNESAAAVITFTNGASLKVRSGKSRNFPLVAANPGETVGIQVRFPANLSGGTFVAQALDGGTVSTAQQSSSVAPDGTSSIQFQVPTRPGLYRVLLNGGGAINTLKFCVSDPQNPSADRAALRPQ